MSLTRKTGEGPLSWGCVLLTEVQWWSVTATVEEMHTPPCITKLASVHLMPLRRQLDVCATCPLAFTYWGFCLCNQPSSTVLFDQKNDLAPPWSSQFINGEGVLDPFLVIWCTFRFSPLAWPLTSSSSKPI